MRLRLVWKPSLSIASACQQANEAKAVTSTSLLTEAETKMNIGLNAASDADNIANCGCWGSKLRAD